MEDAATRFGSDDLSHRIPVSGDDELAQLGNAFNAMASSLQRSRADPRESGQRFQALVHHASDVFPVIGADAVIRYQSPAIEQVLGYPTEGIIGRSFLDLIDPRDQDIARQLFARSRMQPGVPTVGEVRMRPREDVQAPRHFEMTATDLLDDSTVRGLVLNYRDITDDVTAVDAHRARLQPRSRLLLGRPAPPDELAAMLRTVNPTEVTVAARLARLQ